MEKDVGFFVMRAYTRSAAQVAERMEQEAKLDALEQELRAAATSASRIKDDFGQPPAGMSALWGDIRDYASQQESKALSMLAKLAELRGARGRTQAHER